MKKLLVILIVVCVAQMCSAQNVCENNKAILEDITELNITKCSAEERNVTKFIDSQDRKVNLASKRFLKKRKLVNKQAVYVNPVASKAQILHNTFNVEELKDVQKKVAAVAKEIAKEQPISFVEIDQIPQFNSCVNSDLNADDCFNYEMKKHIEENFIYPAEEVSSGKILISFVINIKGKIDKIEITGNENLNSLKKEIKRVVKLLPKFIPGMHAGKETEVFYSFPMTFD